MVSLACRLGRSVCLNSVGFVVPLSVVGSVGLITVVVVPVVAVAVLVAVSLSLECLLGSTTLTDGVIALVAKVETSFFIWVGAVWQLVVASVSVCLVGASASVAQVLVRVVSLSCFIIIVGALSWDIGVFHFLTVKIRSHACERVHAVILACASVVSLPLSRHCL